MSYLQGINPFKVIAVELLPLPTDYAFLFSPLATIGVLAGFIIAAGAKNRFDRAASLLPVFAIMVLCMTAASFLAQKFTLTYFVDEGCPLAVSGDYTTVRPLFVPSQFEKYLPSHGYFDGLSCDQFNHLMLENASVGWFATVGLIAALLAASTTAFGIIFIGAIKAVRKTRQGSAAV